MSLNTAAVNDFLLTMVANPQVLNPLSSSVPVSKPLTFANVSVLKVYTNTFTPANNTFSIETASTITSNAAAPNFMLVLCDAQLNMNIQSSGTYQFVQVPVFPMMLYTTPPALTAYINIVQLDGRTTIANPMAQGVAVNYTLIYGVATIS